MRLIALEGINWVEAGQTLEVSATEACRLVTYGFARPAKPGFGSRVQAQSKSRAGDHALAAALRMKRRAAGDQAVDGSTPGSRPNRVG